MKMNKKSLSLVAISVVAIAMVGFVSMDFSQEIKSTDMSVLMKAQTPFDLAEQADYVIEGTVIDMKAVLIDMPKERDEDRIVTEVTLSVDSDIMNNYGEETITFAIFGGQIGEYIFTSNVSPEFVLGEKVLVYIGEDKENYSYQGRNYVLGNSQGVLEIKDDGTLVDKFRETVYDKELVISKSQQVKGQL